METTYTIATLEDFDSFLADLTKAMIAANPAGWPVTKIALDKIVQDSRAELPST
jgi:hypothetical protein